MSLYPKITLTLWTGFLLVLPLLALRYGLPTLIRKQALRELAFFPPAVGVEKTALKTYFVTNTFLIFSPLLARIQEYSSVSLLGWIIYLLGVILLSISLFSFSTSVGLKSNSLYRFSRNPMCLGYFLIFVGTSVLITSWFHLLVTVIYQLAVHGLILSEERWCTETFGEAYKDYCQTVRRYL